jgi:hypothetical protein
LVIPKVRKTKSRATKLLFGIGFVGSFAVGASLGDCLSTLPYTDTAFYFYLFIIKSSAATCWLLDNWMCPRIKASAAVSLNPAYLYVGSLHGYWHIFMAIHCYCAYLFFTFIRAETLGRNPCYSTKGALPLLPYVRPRDKIRTA